MKALIIPEIKTFDEIVELYKTDAGEDKRTLIQCWLTKYYEVMKSKIALIENQRMHDRAVKYDMEQNEYILERYKVEYGYNLRSLQMLEKQLFK
jgi:hypothetical protein